MKIIRVLPIGAIERPGMYEVNVTASEYLSWFQEKVEEKMSQCSVSSNKITVQLIRSSPHAKNH